MFVAGGVGAGKSTLGELIVTHLALKGTVVTIDSSRCIENSIRRPDSKVGKKLSEFYHKKKRGLLMPPELAFFSILENVYWLEQVLDPVHIIIPGGHRAPDEAGLWKEVRDLISWRLFAIPTTDDEIAFGVYLRQRKGSQRNEDADPTMVADRIREYKELTIPSVETAPQELVRYSARSEPLVKRVTNLIEHLPLEDDTRRFWLMDVANKYRPIRKAISAMNAEEVIARSEFEAAKAETLVKQAIPLVQVHDIIPARSQLQLA
jgi:ABC-type oligopeptide transport system ATPase subunit